MKRKTVFTLFLLTVALNSLAAPGNGKGNKEKKFKEKHEVHTPAVLPSYDWHHDGWYGNDDYYKKNWGFSKDSFKSWLNRHPTLNKKDRKSLEKLYKDHITYERKLRKSFQKYNNEIALLPAYRGQRDPMGLFIEDYLYNRDSIRNYKFSNDFRNHMSREEKAAADFFRFLSNFR